MSKTMKKFLGILLSLAMVLSTAGITVFADETTPSAGTDTAVKATEEPIPDAVDDSTMTGDEAHGTETAVPSSATAEPTEAPTPEPTAEPVSAYANDTYYNRAIVLATTLGIITGYEDGSVQPESSVTRAEMAAIVLRMLNTTAESTYANSFNDVKSEHWAANTIQTAAELGIINGMGDGSFKPDGAVTYEQVVKMIVCALGYDTEARMSGEYPSGYLNKANSLGVNDHAIGTIGEAADRGLVIKMVYNALITYFNEPSGTSPTGLTTYTATRTLAKARFNLIDAKGVLTATSKKTLDPSYAELRDGQIVIDSVQYDTTLTGLEDYVGESIIYFYRDSSASLTPEILAIVPSVSSKTDSVEVNLDEIDKLTGFDSSAGVVEMEKGSDKKCKDAVINYNGKIITPADYARALADDPARFQKRDYAGASEGSKTFNEFLIPDKGTMKLTDADGDGNYDYMFIEDYETMTVQNVSAKKLTGNINNETVVIDIDTDANIDLDLTVIKGGSEVRARNLKEDDVASVLRSLDGQSITITVTGESVTGKVSAVAMSNGKRVVTIANEKYVVDPNAVSSIKSGTEGVFYTDMFGRIAAVESSGSGKLSGSEKYGWIMNAYLDDNGKDYRVKMFTQDGKAEEFTLASNVDLWAPNAAAASTVSGNNRSDITKLVSEDGFISSGSHQIRLCKFKSNTNGQITKLYMACDASVVSNEDALVIDTASLRNTGSVGNLINGRIIEDGVVGFSVPDSVSDMGSEGNYSSFSVSASSYLSADGVNVDFIIGEFTDERRANVLVRFESSADATVSASDYSTVGDNPVMVVTSIDPAIDENEEPIYIISGKRNGGDVSYTTSSNTTLAKISTGDLFGDKNTYASTTLWTAESDTPIYNYLQEGDIVGISSNSRGAAVILKMVDIEALADLVATGTGAQYTGYARASETRDGIAIGAVADVNTMGNTFFSVKKADNTAAIDWYLESSVTVDMIEVTTNANGFVRAKVSKDSYEPAEMFEFSSRNTEGDYIFFRNFKNNAQREAVIIRFNY